MYFPVVDYFQLHIGFSGIKTKILKDISGNKFPDMEEYKEKLVKHLFKHFCKNAKRFADLFLRKDHKKWEWERTPI